MKKPTTIFFLFAVIFSLVLLTYPKIFLGNTTDDSLAATTKTQIHKKSKKKAKKLKSAKVKVSKSSAGSQDEVSDQTEVSQQADSSGNKKKK
jgi:hypothetical protein